MNECLVVIPAHNEEMNIEKVLVEIRGLKLDVDVLVINDGSTDNTAAVVQANRTTMVSLPFNLGYGGALQTGFKYAMNKGYKYVIQFDGDGQHDTQDLETIVKELKIGTADIVIGSRFLGRGAFKAGFMKMTAIAIFRFIIKGTTGVWISDPSSGLQGLTRRTFAHYAKMGHFPSDFPDADILIQMILNGYKVKEFPANIRERNQGTSMHAGLRPVFYFMKMLVSILVVLLRPRTMVEG